MHGDVGGRKVAARRRDLDVAVVRALVNIDSAFALVFAPLEALLVLAASDPGPTLTMVMALDYRGTSHLRKRTGPRGVSVFLWARYPCVFLAGTSGKERQG